MSRRIMSRRVLAGLCLLVVPALSAAEENVYKKGLKSTVWIVQPAGANRLRTGSGSLIDAQKRLVLTNHHVVGDQKDATVFFPIIDAKGNLVPERGKYTDLLRSGGGIPAKVLFSEPSKDLALIQLATLPKGAPPVRLAKDGPSPGDRVHSIGSPGVSGALFNYTDGSVKSVYQKKYRTGSGPNDPNSFLIDARVIETSSGTNKGDSGGPLLNDRCELIGVTQGIMIGGDDTRPISYFIEVGEVKNLLKIHKISLSSTPATTTAAEAPMPAKPAEKPAEAPAAAGPTSQKKLEQEAAARLSGARLFVASNKKQARELLQEIIDKYPSTEAAGEAKKLLEKVK